MRDVKGRVAIVSGGAEGAGLGIASVLVEAGMQVVLADSREAQLAPASEQLGKSCHPLHLDVTDRDGWTAAADQAEQVFGPVHVAVMAGDSPSGGTIAGAELDEVDRILGDSLGGMINGVRTLLPRILAHGEGGHVVCCGSVAALVPIASRGVWSVAQRSILGLVEGIRAELVGSEVGISMLFADQLRAAGNGRDVEIVDPLQLGRRALEGILRNDLYVFATPGPAEEIAAGFEPIVAASEEVPEQMAPPPFKEIPGMPVFGLPYTPAGRSGAGVG